MNMTKRKTIVFHYLLLIGFIFINGLILFLASNSGEVSGNQSSFLLSLITNITRGLGINFSVAELDNLHMLIRKMIGHFGIFLLDGVLGILTIKSWLKVNALPQLWITLGIGLGVASLSEIIQLFAPERGPSVYDVFLDFSGYILGVLVVLVIINLLNKKPKPTT